MQIKEKGEMQGGDAAESRGDRNGESVAVSDDVGEELIGWFGSERAQ